MVANSHTISVPIGFDAEGFDEAVKCYLAGLKGQPLDQAQYDLCVEQISAMASRFVKVGDFG